MKNILLVCLICIIAGCQGKHCFKVVGDYKGVDGEIEYCFDRGESKSLEAPILKDKEGKKVVIVNEEQMNKILDKVPKPMVTKKIEKDGIKEDTLTKFLRLLKD